MPWVDNSLKLSVVPYSWFTGKPDFSDVSIIDEGQTLRLGGEQVSADLLFSASTTVTAYQLLMLELVHEMNAGRGDDDYADQIRDPMDPLWWQMTADEQFEMAQYSESLYCSSR